MKLSLTFDDALDHYKDLFELLMDAFDGSKIQSTYFTYFLVSLISLHADLLNSKSLKEIMFIVLLIGNIINGVSCKCALRFSVMY